MSDSESNPLEWRLSTDHGSVLVRCTGEPTTDDVIDLTDAFGIIVRTLSRIASNNRKPIKVKWSDFYPDEGQQAEILTRNAERKGEK